MKFNLSSDHHSEVSDRVGRILEVLLVEIKKFDNDENVELLLCNLLGNLAVASEPAFEVYGIHELITHAFQKAENSNQLKQFLPTRGG